MTRQESLRRVLADHVNVGELWAQLGRLLPAMVDLLPDREAGQVLTDTIDLLERIRSTSLWAARLAAAAGDVGRLSVVPALRLCPCGSSRKPLRRFHGEEPAVCPACYMRQRRAA